MRSPAFIFAFSAFAPALLGQNPIGAPYLVGTNAIPAKVDRLLIEKPGIYENFLVDEAGVAGNLVKITADDVVLRSCEIRNGAANGVGIFGTHVLIENCHIHHMLAGTFTKQADAHGIAGDWGDVTIRGCEIAHTSGDAIQFDPGRASSGSLVVERCTLRTGPLPEASGGFLEGERPGENGLDTKVRPDGPRCVLTIRDCLLIGWNQPAAIQNAAALNLKENVDAEVIRCVFRDNEIAMRLRGPRERGGAHVRIIDCAIYDSLIGIRAEDGIEKLEIDGLGFGGAVGERVRFVNGPANSGFTNTGEHEALPFERLMREGFLKR